MSMIRIIKNALINHKLISLVKKIRVFGGFKTRMKSKASKSLYSEHKLEDNKMKL